MPTGKGFRDARLQEIAREIAYLREKADSKRSESVKVYYANPELCNRLMQDALRIESEIDKLTLLQLNYKQNPLSIPIAPPPVPFRRKVTEWVKGLLRK